jgi:putative salt-induced outer membrane protein
MARIDALVARIERDEKVEVGKAGFLGGFSGEAALGGYLSTGNTDEWGLTGALAMKRQGLRWVHNLDVKLDVKEENGARSSERLFANYILRRNFKGSRWFAFAGLRFEHDRFQGIERRFGQAAGPGYQLLKGKKAEWEVMAGPALRQTRFVGEPDSTTFGLFGRTRFSWKLTDTLRFSQNIDGVFDGDNNGLTSTSAVTSDLYGDFALRLSFTAELETDPPEGREKMETYTRATLIYDF